MRRLEVHTADLAQAEDRLTEAEDGVIGDVQRFGDRLDVIVKDPAAGRAAVEATLAKAGIAIRDIRVADPMLENTFVARLRAMGQELHAPPFPGRHPHRNLKGEIAIGAENLTKRFGAFTAVHNVNLNVRYGEVYGLLGANGAGKTTTIKMLCGLLDPTTGTPQLAGQQGAIRSASVRELVGYMSQKFSLYDDLSIDENLDFFAGVYGVPANEIVEKKKWVLDFSGLAGKEQQITGSLPGGWKQRVAFGAATMHEPGVLFLDEPTSVWTLWPGAFNQIIANANAGNLQDVFTSRLGGQHDDGNGFEFGIFLELAEHGYPSMTGMVTSEDDRSPAFLWPRPPDLPRHCRPRISCNRKPERPVSQSSGSYGCHLLSEFL